MCAVRVCVVQLRVIDGLLWCRGGGAASACCLSVVYDGADPKRCGVGLICRTFENAGLFGNRVICHASR